MLEAEVQAKIFSLFWNEKMSIRKIASLVSLDRKTVKRVIENKKVILERRAAGRVNLLDAYRDQVKEMLVKDPTMAATTVMHRLRDGGYMGGSNDCEDVRSRVENEIA